MYWPWAVHMSICLSDLTYGGMAPPACHIAALVRLEEEREESWYKRYMRNSLGWLANSGGGSKNGSNGGGGSTGASAAAGRGSTGASAAAGGGSTGASDAAGVAGEAGNRSIQSPAAGPRDGAP